MKKCNCNHERPPRLPVRICRNCGLSISSYHKFRFVIVKGLYTVEHRHCDNPDDYISLENRARVNAAKTCRERDRIWETLRREGAVT